MEPHRSLKLFLGAVRDFMEIFNGPMRERGVLVHYCRGRECCKDDLHTSRRMCKALRRVILRRVPPTPAANEWTELSTCLDIVLLGLLSHCALQLLFCAGLDNLEFKDIAEGLGKDVDCELAHDIAYRHVAGTRYNAGRELLSSREYLMKMTILAVPLEAIRYLTGWFIRRAREEPSDREVPPLCDMVH